MKKLFVIAAVLCFALNSQTVKAQGVDLGVKLGANFASISEIDHAENKTGFVGGVFLGINFNKFTIQPELLYSQQGAKLDIGKFNLDYINVPVMFKFYIIGETLNLQAGPQFGFVVNDELTLEGISDQLEAESFDLSGAVGAGLDLPFGLRLSARYHFGFTDVANSLGHNKVVTVAVGYSFL